MSESYDDEMQRRLLEHNARSAFDRVGDQTRLDLLGMAQKDSPFATNIGAHDMLEQNRLNIDQPVYPIIRGQSVQVFTEGITGVSNDYSVSPYESAIQWFNPADHTKTYVPNLTWVWGLNIVADLSTTLPDLGGIAGTANTTFTIALVDQTGTEISNVTYAATYDVFFDAVNFIWVTDVTQSRPVFGANFRTFNGIKIKSTNDNTMIVPPSVRGDLYIVNEPVFPAFG